MNMWEDDAARGATWRRRKLIFSGLLTEACVTFPVLSARNAKIQLDREIAAENLAFCEKFGIRGDTSDFGACSQRLAIVRQKQADRDSAAAASLPLLFQEVVDRGS